MPPIWCVWRRNCALKCASRVARCPPKANSSVTSNEPRLARRADDPAAGGLAARHVFQEYVVAIAVAVGGLLAAEALPGAFMEIEHQGVEKRLDQRDRPADHQAPGEGIEDDDSFSEMQQSEGTGLG